MKALIQRVKKAHVAVDSEVINSIEQGVCVLIGISTTDTLKDIKYMVRKLLSVKLFEDNSRNKWKRTVVDKQYEVLCVSQFTLYNTWKGNRPDFHKSMPMDKAHAFYDKFIQLLKEAYEPDKVKEGMFGAYMQVTIQNDGPVTFEIESPPHLHTKEDKSQRIGVQEVPQVDLNNEDELSN